MAGLEKAGVSLVAENASQFFGDMNKAGDAVNAFSRDTTTASGKVSSASEIMTGALRHIGTIAIDAFMQAGRAAIGFVSDSISAAGDFESGMNKFAAVAGGALEESGLQLKDFRDQFIQIGKELPVSTAEVQEAAIEMVKGGIEPATIAAGGLEQVIQFAAAADLDLAQASTIAAKALGGWTDMTASADEKAAFLTHSTDLLARAANASTVDVDDLALGLYNVQGTAKLAGVSFDETVTTLAQLAPNFASSADAGTSFKAFLGRLNPTTKPAIAAMQALNLATKDGKSVFYDAQGNFVGMAKASQLLQDATKDLTEEQRIQMLQTIFGQDAIRVAAVLSQQGADGYDAMTASLEKQNSVADMAKQKQAGFNTAMDNFKGSVEALQITIGSYLLPVLTTLFNDYLAPGINTITAFAESIFAADDPILALTTAIDSVLPGFQQFADFMAVAIPTAINFLMEHLTAIEGALVALGVVIAGAAVAGAIASLMNPITLVIGGIALLGAAWAEDWGGIRTTLTEFWETTGKPIFDEVVTWLEDNIPKAIDTLSDFWENTLLPALTMVWEFINTNVIPILKTLVDVYFKAVETELRLLAGFWTNTLLPAITDVWSFLDKYIIPIMKAVANVEIAALKLALRELTDIWNTVLLPAITTVYNFFKDNVIPIFSDTGDEGSELSKSIRETLGPAFTWLGDNILKPAVGWFKDIGTAIDGVVGWLNTLAEKINSLPSLPDPFVGHSPPPIANWMGDIADAAQFVSGALGEVTAAIADLPKSLPKWAGDIGSGIGLGSGNASDLFNSSSMVRAISSAGMLMARGAAASTSTYNQQRTANITYHTTHAPSVSQSWALANALSGGS